MKILLSAHDFHGTVINMIMDRPEAINRVLAALKRSRVVALVGPRQCGKTTLAQILSKGQKVVHYFDLEDTATIGILDEPMSTLRDLSGLVIIDEVQRRPELFPVLRVLSDRKPLPAKFLILGSASPGLLKQASESLAGRIEVVELSGFSLLEVGSPSLDQRWLHGGFPPSFTAGNSEDSYIWRRQFIQTFLERDLPIFGIRIPASTLLRFWTMLAHYHGQIWKASEPARSMGVNETTVRRYLDLLESFFMIRVLQPWHANLGKRQVKSPKIYFRDSGILHALLGMRTHMDLLSHPKCGASWEGMIVEEVLQRFGGDDFFFWATHNGAELDLVLHKRGRFYGVECKRTDSPRLTPSIRIGMEDLELDRVWIIYSGEKRYHLAEGVDAIPASELASAEFTFD
jgi:predicted AAA+ superfamily ATPase